MSIIIIYFFSFQREDQRVSTAGRSILAVFSAVVIITASLGAASVIAWLDFLYYCSYIKLCITLIKYVPQVRYIGSYRILRSMTLNNILYIFF